MEESNIIDTLEMYQSSKTAPRLQKKDSETKYHFKIRPNCYAIRPNLGGYTQWVR